MRKPVPLRFHELGFPDEIGVIRCLHSRRGGSWCVFLSLRGMDGCGDLGLAEVRRLHDWLGRFIQFAESKGQRR